MTITEAQRKRRQGSIGGSDQGAIWGLDPFRSAEDVRLSKVHDLEEIPGNHAMDLGNRLEDVVIDWLVQQIGCPPIRRNVFRRGENPLLHASLDFQVVGEPEIGEVKFTHKFDEWGESGSDEIPTRVFLQAQHNMYCAEAKRCHVGVLAIDGYTLQFRSYLIERDEAVIQRVVQKTTEWWEKHVNGNEPCSGDVPSLETLRRIPRDEEARVQIDDTLVNNYEQLRRGAKWANEQLERAKAKLVAALGNAQAGETPSGGVVTFREQTRKAYEVAEKRYRTLRVKTAPESGNSPTPEQN